MQDHIGQITSVAMLPVHVYTVRLYMQAQAQLELARRRDLGETVGA